MLDKKSMLLFVSCWLLLAVLSLPSGASAATSPQMSDAGTVSSDTFPIMENQFAVRQAHLAYLAVKEEVGMQATIRYIAARNGSTGTLSTPDGEDRHIGACHKLRQVPTRCSMRNWRTFAVSPACSAERLTCR